MNLIFLPTKQHHKSLFICLSFISFSCPFILKKKCESLAREKEIIKNTFIVIGRDSFLSLSFTFSPLFIISIKQPKKVVAFLFISCRIELNFLNWMGLNKYCRSWQQRQRKRVEMTLIFINAIDFFSLFFPCPFSSFIFILATVSDW